MLSTVLIVPKTKGSFMTVCHANNHSKGAGPNEVLSRVLIYSTKVSKNNSLLN